MVGGVRRNGPAVRPAESAGRTAGRQFGRPAGRPDHRPGRFRRSGRPNRPADTAAEPNRRNLTGRAEPPPRVPPVHSVQPAAWLQPRLQTEEIHDDHVKKISRRNIFSCKIFFWRGFFLDLSLPPPPVASGDKFYNPCPSSPKYTRKPLECAGNPKQCNGENTRTKNPQNCTRNPPQNVLKNPPACTKKKPQNILKTPLKCSKKPH